MIPDIIIRTPLAQPKHSANHKYKKWVQENYIDIISLYNIYNQYLPDTLTTNEFANYIYASKDINYN